ncbi:uncharacterized protein LOC130722320 [Lotus japonicus]|uniref:uncharacterized protein LOC130722320 n=1 Tax=Lotus japonicus TaxID=34305 RepID=UPI00258420C0|nr:uncharacterized protein LOC130722320 [Lotus japonicus]
MTTTLHPGGDPRKAPCEGNDQADRSNKKVKTTDCVTVFDSEMDLLEENNPRLEGLQKESKMSYKDKVIAGESFTPFSPQEIVDLVREELAGDDLESMKLEDERKPFSLNPVVPVSLEEYEEWCRPWKFTLVVKLQGKKIGFRWMDQRLHRIWAKEGDIKVIDLAEDYYLVRFASENDYRVALFEGPWMIADHYLLVQRWRPRFKANDEAARKIAVWIRFPELDVELCNEKFLWRLGSLLGTMLKIDTHTSVNNRAKFARICVEIDLNCKLSPTFTALGEVYRLEYEGLHAICFSCGKYGHKSDRCPERTIPTPLPSSPKGNDPMLPASEDHQPKSKVIQEQTEVENDTPSGFGPWMLVKKPPKRKPLKPLNQTINQHGNKSRFSALNSNDEPREQPVNVNPHPGQENHQQQDAPKSKSGLGIKANKASGRIATQQKIVNQNQERVQPQKEMQQNKDMQTIHKGEEVTHYLTREESAALAAVKQFQQKMWDDFKSGKIPEDGLQGGSYVPSYEELNFIKSLMKQKGLDASVADMECSDRCKQDSLHEAQGAGKKNFTSFIKDCSRIYHLGFVAILEPRISGEKADKVLSNMGFDSITKTDANGFSGGIWCCWKQSMFSIRVVALNQQCIHLHVNPNDQGGWYLTVVYAHPQERMRVSLWNDLVNFKDQTSGPWFVAGDFNSVLFEAEKVGGAPFNRQAANKFQECLNITHLEDLGAKGVHFTWQRGDLFERLDRAVSNAQWRTRFPAASITNLPLPFSDHCALWLRLNVETRSPKPFKFLAAWSQHPEFQDLIKNNWRASSSWQGNITNCTETLMEWNKLVFGDIFRTKKRLLARMEGIQKKIVQNPNPFLMKLRKRLWTDYETILRSEELYWAQQAKINWLNLGDRNTKFFHQSTIARQQRNKVEALLNEEGEWTYDSVNLKRLIVNYFKSLFSTDQGLPYSLCSSSSFPKLSGLESTEMMKLVTHGEVKKAFFSIGNLKSPGPDGFHAVFFKQNWDLIGDSLISLIRNIFSNPALIKNVNQTVLALIPKVQIPERVSQFRPIALCNTSYKVVTKILANRIRDVLPNLISVNQSSFVQGRSTMDNILSFQEMIHSLRSLKGKKGFMAIKLDLEKAYDRLLWPFIEDTLQFFGFDENFIHIIYNCVSTSSIAIAWQGDYTDYFNPQRGIRQGDPISPYLFVLCIERLSHIIQDACGIGSWKPFKVGRHGPSISHLLFADDVILMAEASDDQASLIHNILNKFCDASGQKVSLAKSRVFFSKNTNAVIAGQLASKLGIQQTHNLGMYLGVPLLHSRMIKENFSFLIDKVRRKLSGWKAKSLSFAGRVSLTQTCLLNLPAYVMQTTPIPMGVCQDIEKLCRDFIWGSTVEARKCHLINWSTICSPKSEGGLGLRDLHSINRAFMTKLAWNIKKSESSLWVSIFLAKYKFNPRLGRVPIPKSTDSPTWKGICKAWPIADLGSLWRVGNGQTTLFWSDTWNISLGNLSDYIPEDSPEWVRFLPVNYYAENGHWKRETLNLLLPPAIVNKVCTINPPDPTKGEDFLSWKPNPDGKFSINYVYPLLLEVENQNTHPSFEAIWKFKGPPKVQSFLWKVAHNKILTNQERMKRNMSTNATCPRCLSADETVIHAIRDCPFIQQVWNSFLLPRDWSRFYSQGISDWLNFNLRRNAVYRGRFSWPLLFGLTTWQIWKDRCDLIFNNHITLPCNLIILIYSLAEEITRNLARPTTVHNLHCRKQTIHWVKPDHGVWKLNTDGSVRESIGKATCGGLIRDWEGKFIKGFCNNLAFCNPLFAELWGVFNGLKIAYEMKPQQLTVELDSSEAFKLITLHCDVNHPCAGLVKEISDLATRNWKVTFSDIYKEANKSADYLASYCYGKPDLLIDEDQIPPPCSLF